MSLHQKRRETPIHLSTVHLAQVSPLDAYCTCEPLSPFWKHSSGFVQNGSVIEDEQCVPATSLLNTRLYALLQELLPTTPLFSILLLHVAQVEPLSSDDAALFQRRYTHISANQREQIFANIHRVLRMSDRLWLEDDAGGAFVFPDVDYSGMEAILERVYQSVSLLQAETVVPPLTQETTLLLGYGSFSLPGSSLEEVLFDTSRSARRRLTLRPTLFNQFADTPASLPSGIMHARSRQQGAVSRTPSRVPFLDLPRALPQRLKQLLPYEVAAELRCAPVGREQQRLTVAMADPHDGKKVQRLCEVTGMEIFPVSCEIEDLDLLLGNIW